MKYCVPFLMFLLCNSLNGADSQSVSDAELTLRSSSAHTSSTTESSERVPLELGADSSSEAIEVHDAQSRNTAPSILAMPPAAPQTATQLPMGGVALAQGGGDILGPVGAVGGCATVGIICIVGCCLLCNK